MEIEDADRLVGPRRSPLPFIAAGSLLVIVAIAVLVAWPSEPDPTQVLVVVRGCSHRCTSAVLVGVERTLVAGGFEVVRAEGSPSDAEQAREAAASQGAQHALFVEVSVSERRDPGPIDPAYASATAAATLSSITGETSITASSPRVAAHGMSLERALEDVGAELAAPIADSVHLALLERESVRAFSEEVISDAERNGRQRAIRAALPRVSRVHEEHEWMRDSCESAAAELRRGGGRCVSDACAEEYAFDLLADGSAALVHVETPAARVPLDDGRTTSAERVETEETLEVVRLDGSERRVIGRADNYYTYPAYAEGRVIAIEEWPGGFGMISIDVETGARTALARFDGRFVQSPELSPDGTRVMYRLRASRRAPAQLVVSPVRAEPPMTLLGEAELGTWVMLAVVEGEPARTLVAELVERPAPIDEQVAAEEPNETGPIEPPADGLYPLVDWTKRLALLDPESGETVALLDDDRLEVDRVAGVIDGRVAFTWTNGDASGVALWDPRSGQVSHTPTRRYLRDARAAGARLVGISEGEVVSVDPSDGSVRTLTSSALRERYPRAAGGRVIFDRVGQSRYRSFPRVATCWLESD